MATDFPFGTDGLDTFPAAATLAGHQLATDPHSTLHGDLGDSITAIETYTRPTINARAYGCKADDTTNDASTISSLIAFAIAYGRNVHFPAGIYRCDDGTTATPVVADFTAAAGNICITGDGIGQTVFISHVPLNVANKALIDFTGTNSATAPICEGFSVQGPGTYANPQPDVKTGTTSGTGTQITSVTGLQGSWTGRLVTGTGIPAGAYVKKVSGTTATISAALTGAGGAGTTVTFGLPSPFVGCGLRISSASQTNGCGARGWYAGFLTTSEADSSIATDHFTIAYPSCDLQENGYGHYIQDTTGGTLDFKWFGVRTSRNAMAGIAVGDNAKIASASMYDVHFNSQPWHILKEGVAGVTPTEHIFIDGLVMERVKFEGCGNMAIHDVSGLATVRGLVGYIEMHGVEINGQRTKTSLTTFAINDHTRRDITISTMSRSGVGLVTATTSPSLAAEDVGKHIAVASPLVTGTGSTTNGSPSVTSTTGFGAGDVGRIIIGKGIPANAIIGAYAGGTITLHDYTGANVNANASGSAVTLAASAFHGAYIIKSVSGSTVTWDTTIQTAFGAEAGALGRIGFIRCGSLDSIPNLLIDFQNDPSVANTFPERFFDLLDAQDVTIRPTEADKLPVNFPQMNLRTADATYNARKANVCCIQGLITAWLGKCAGAVTAGFVVKPGAGGIALAHHAGTAGIPVGGMALQPGAATTSATNFVATRPWIWVQDFNGAFIDSTTHGPGLAATSGAAEKVLVIDTGAAGKVIEWNLTDVGKIVVAYSTAAAGSGVIPAKSVSPYLTAV